MANRRRPGAGSSAASAGSAVARRNVQVHSAGSLASKGRDECGDQLAAVSAGLQAWQQVDVQVRGVARGQLVRNAPGVVDHVCHSLAGCPLPWRKLRWGIGVAGAQGRPPVAFQPPFERLGIERAEDVAAHAVGVFGHEGQGWLEQAVGACENVPEQPRIVKQRGRVLAVGACQQADLVQGAEVAGLVGADVSAGAIHGPPYRAPAPRAGGIHRALQTIRLPSRTR
jgi:hypothetical protein